MDEVHCSLCCDLLKSLEFNLRSTISKHSYIPLISLVEGVTGPLFNLYFNICLPCYNLINELDAIEVRQIEIHNQLKKYYERGKQRVSLSPEEEIDTKNIIEIEDTIINEISDINLSYENEKINLDREFLSQVGLRPVTESFTLTLTDNKREENTEDKNKSTTILETVSKPNTKEKGKKIKKPHKCYCAKEFRTLGQLKTHNSRCDYRPFVCDICGQSYKHQSAFNIHVDMHNGINPFTCVYCNKSFTQKGALARHVPMHTGEKRHQCDECGKRFIHHTSFKIHRLSHTGQRSYKCELCGLALISGSHLKRHIRVHTGEKKFICSICGKSFAEKYNLVAHEKLHFNPNSVLSRKPKRRFKRKKTTSQKKETSR